MTVRFSSTIRMSGADSDIDVARIVLTGDRLGWTVEVGLERGGNEVGVHRRSFGNSEVGGLNVIGVLRYALNQLDSRAFQAGDFETSLAEIARNSGVRSLQS